jgi:hypothetical protein
LHLLAEKCQKRLVPGSNRTKKHPKAGFQEESLSAGVQMKYSRPRMTLFIGELLNVVQKSFWGIS